MTEDTTIIDRCRITGEMYSVTVKTADLARFEKGEGLVQNIFPYLSAGDREFVKTRISPNGWDKLFPKEEQDE
jgi:hypothetical protein